MVAMNEPEYSAVEVLKSRVRLVMTCELFSCEKETTFDPLFSWQRTLGTLTLLMRSWHPVTAEREKAEVKLTERSKLELLRVIALSWMVYCELGERAVLGEVAEDATVKLS
jgi:hypothetical protein